MLNTLTLTLLLLPQQPIQQKVASMRAEITAARLEHTIRALVACGTRHVASSPDGATRAKAGALDFLEAEARACIAGSGGRLTVERKSYEVFAQRLGKSVTVTNVVATLRGTSDPERIYVLGGHYDSINSNPRDAAGVAPGANDDGSGTAAVLEALRVMAGREFAATILFCCYDAEEMGLLGSTAHAEELAKAGARIDGMITNDICGNTLGMDGKRHDAWMRCFSYSPRGNDGPGRSFARAAAYAQRTHVPDLEVRLVLRGDRFGRGGDHRPFANQGFPALRFSEAREDFSRQHQNVTERDGKPYGDLPEFVDHGYLARLCAVDVATLAEVASAPPPPAEVRVQGSRSSYDTTVSWPASAAGHEIVWRLTTASDWEHAVAGSPIAGLGRLSQVLPGVCIDDVVIGVRALGKDGSRSRTTTPAEPDAFDQRPAPASRRSGR